MAYFAVMIGGGLGAVLRYIISIIAQRYSPNFPIGTMIINTTGAFFIGFLSVYLTEILSTPPSFRLFMITGILGGYTTFSTYTLEGFSLIDRGEYLKAFYYIIGTNLIGFLFVWLGRVIGERL